ncbi:MAG: carboxymuconolactone decarboxylase family protein [Pseudomonadales bacterium]|nr:carboxymuconolactone decarboxylase family protein [Pseudomonadales bacterium]MBO6567001.1 carboxymuconolactone decarboxylase family protein [Pseudomonadales bacterium]MBO6597682.1 carboxymuconolactone decarboxylase family protein [Pseudomonadales bacterium]MBO6658039.1 carboxymuconolactone decarboxylase family protein [Pseudomonadales bacterium]MBO6703997.1 carboxymuconolactone decarboxylase family protein [Pseudomonadales bacterium]
MPRLRQVSRGDADKSLLPVYEALFGDRDPVAEPGTATGTPGNWWTVFALVPECFHHAVEGFQFYRSKQRKLSPKLRELGQARAGFARGSQFVFSQHCKALRGAGFTEEQISAIPSWASSDCFDELERAVLAYTDDLVLSGGRVPDGTFEILKKYLSDEEILEFTYITCTYEMHATMCRALRLEYDDVDERVVEIPIPDGETRNIDFMRAVDSNKKQDD